MEAEYIAACAAAQEPSGWSGYSMSLVV